MSTRPQGQREETAGSDRHPSQWLALIVGATYTLVGVVGFVVTGFGGFAKPDGELLLGVFEVNPLHNLVHVVIGVAGLALWSTLGGTRTYGWLLVAAYTPAFLYGLAVASSDQPANFLALNAADNWLYLASVLAGLVMALLPSRATSARRA